MIVSIKNEVIRNVLQTLRFDFKGRKLLLQFGDDCNINFVKQSFTSLKIAYQLISKKEIIWVQVNIEECTADRLKQVCQISILYKKQTEIEQQEKPEMVAKLPANI